MKYIISLPMGGTPYDLFCEHHAAIENVLKNAKPVMTLDEYHKANPKRPTGGKVQEIYIEKDVEPKSCFSCYWNNTSSEDCIGCIGFGNWREGVK